MYTELQVKQIKEFLDYYTESEQEKRYNDYLNWSYGTIVICELEYESSNALKSVDPIAYRAGMNDFIDNLLTDEKWVKVDGEYYEKCAVDELLESLEDESGEDE